MRESCEPREPSAPKSYGNADQNRTDRDHRQAGDPRSIASVTPKRMSAHEEHPDGDEVRESQRQCRIVDENEREC
jgi:hypothetical protein